MVRNTHTDQCNGLLGGPLRPLSHDEVDGVHPSGDPVLSLATSEQSAHDAATNLASAISSYGTPGHATLMSAISECVSLGSRQLALQESLATLTFLAPHQSGGSAGSSSCSGLV